MKIKNLELLNFRNYSSLKIDFDEKLNLIYGNNGEGKTNIVEAIFLLAYTKSFRTSNDKYMIKFKEQLLRVSGNIIKNNMKDNYAIIIDSDGKTVKINNDVCKRLSDYISKINVILFSRDDLNLIKDSPNTRRKNINIDISGFNNLYLKKLTIYNKLLKQRNTYLKSLYMNGNLPKDYLNILTNNLVKVGKEIYNIRMDYINNINTYLQGKYISISGNNLLKLNYISEFKESEEKILQKYRSIYSKELQFGKTLLGIHHDDYVFELNEMNIKNFGSEGQQKNAIIAYKLALIEYLKTINIKPIFILDDMFSELDMNKINNIFNLLDTDLQVFITTTEIDNIQTEILNNSKKIHIDNGTIEVI